MLDATISETVINADREGFLLSYEGLALDSDNRDPRPYITAHGKNLINPSAPLTSGKGLLDAREFSKPTIIASGLKIAEGPDITSGGIIIKGKDSMDVALPDAFGQFLPAVDAASKDLLQLYGRAGFENTSMQLVVQRTTMEPNEAHRKPFKHWHDHMDIRRSPSIDLVYAFSDVLPTEFSIQQQEVPTKPESLTRFGAEHLHRSPTNTSESPLRRTWGGIIVIPFGHPNIFAKNNILGAAGELREQFKERARHFFESHPGLVPARSEPQQLGI